MLLQISAHKLKSESVQKVRFHFFAVPLRSVGEVSQANGGVAKDIVGVPDVIVARPNIPEGLLRFRLGVVHVTLPYQAFVFEQVRD